MGTSTRRRLQVLRALFAEAHLVAMQALASADYDAFVEAVRIERELVREHVALLTRARPGVRDPGPDAATSAAPSAAAPDGARFHADALAAFRVEVRALLHRATRLEWAFRRPAMQQRAASLQHFIAGRLRAIADLDEDLRSWDLAELLRGYTRAVEELETALDLHGADAELGVASSTAQEGGVHGPAAPPGGLRT